MIDSAVWLDGEGAEGAGRSAEVVVQPDASGECEELGGDPCAQAVQSAGVVAFEAEAVFECPEDALDALADRREVRAVAGLVLALGTQDRRAEAFADGGLKRLAGVALVGDHELAAMQPAFHESERDVSLLLISGREDRCPRGPVGRGEQMQPHPPEPSRMRAALVMRAPWSTARRVGPCG